MEEVRSTIDEGFEVMRATEEYCHHAELYWLKGRLVLACPEDLDMEAEACFQ